MPDQPRVYGTPVGIPGGPSEVSGKTTAPRQVARPPTDAEVKAAYQKYMRQVVEAAHQHFHEHVQRVRGSSQTAPRTHTSVPGIDAAVDKATR